MKNLGILLFVWIAVSACNKLENKLEGKWQMQQVEYANGVVEPVDTIFYNFMSTVFSYQFYNPATDGFGQAGGYRHEIDENNIRLEFKPETDFTSSLEQLENFVYGRTDWEDLTRDFEILKLSNKTLVLRSEGKTYTFRSF